MRLLISILVVAGVGLGTMALVNRVAALRRIAGTDGPSVSV